MKTLILSLTFVAACCAAVAQPVNLAAVRTELRAAFDEPRLFNRPTYLTFYSAQERQKEPKQARRDMYQRRADALYRALWVVKNKSGTPCTSLAYMLATIARGGELGNDATVYLLRSPEAQSALATAVRGALAQLSSPDVRAFRMPVERVARVVDEMERGATIPNQEWGRAFGDLLAALRR